MDIAGIYRSVFEAIHARSVDRLVEAASDLLGMPIVVVDATFMVLAKHPACEVGDEQWDANRVNHQVRPEYIKVFQQDDHWSAYRPENDRVVLFDWGFFAPAPRYSAQIVDQGKVTGYVSALLGDGTAEEWHFGALRIIADGLSIILERENRSKHSADVMATVMLQGLLLGEYESEVEIQRLCEITGDTVKPDFILAAIKTRRPQHIPLEEYLGKTFTRHFQKAPRVAHDDRLYILLTGLDATFRAKDASESAIPHLKEAGAICALSRVFSDLSSVPDCKWQVDRLLDLGMTHHPDITLLSFDDFELPVLISSLSEVVSPGNIIHPLLHKLARYDDAHNTEYLETLGAYIYSYFNNSATTELLQIHRNTLLYRLGKIEELAETSLTTGDLGHRLYLSFRYLDTNGIRLGDGKPGGRKVNRYR